VQSMCALQKHEAFALSQHLYDHILAEIWILPDVYTRGGDKSLARPTSRCRRTESIVSLERGVFLVPNCKYSVVTEAERKQVRRRARFQQHGDASCNNFFFLQGKTPKEFTLFWQKHYGNMHHHMPPSKTGWPCLNVVISSPVIRLVLDDPKQWPFRRLLIKFTS